MESSFCLEKKKGMAENISIFDRIRSTAYRHRASVLPKVPRTLEETIISDQLKLTDNGETFVILNNPFLRRLRTLCSPQALISLSTYSSKTHLSKTIEHQV